MKINHSKSFTLVEVLVASLVVSIILLGVITSSIALNNNARYSAGSYYVTQNTQTILNDILNAASQAMGSPQNPGFVGIDDLITDIDSSGTVIQTQLGPAGDLSDHELDALNSGDTNNNTFCVHQNLKFDGSFDPINLNLNHRWKCYTFRGYNLYSCIKVYTDVDCPPNTSCYAANQPGACGAITDKLLGALKVKPRTEFTIDGRQGRTLIFKVTLQSCLNPSATATCVDHSSSNPYVEKTGKISPQGHSSS